MGRGRSWRHGAHLRSWRAYHDAAGNVSGREIDEQDDQRKPLKTAAYDAKGDLIFVEERGNSPIFYGTPPAGKPLFMCAGTQT